MPLWRPWAVCEGNQGTEEGCILQRCLTRRGAERAAEKWRRDQPGTLIWIERAWS